MKEQAAGCHNHELSKLLEYEEKLTSLIENEVAGYRTEKAKETALLKFFPPEYRIRQEIFDKNDQEGIQAAMHHVLQQGYRVGLRVCYLQPQLGKGLWLMNLKTAEEIDFLFENKASQTHLPWVTSEKRPLSTYQQILTDENAAEVIVLYNPPGLGLKQQDCYHFISALFLKNDQLVIETIPRTSQLRDLEKKTPISVSLDAEGKIYCQHPQAESLKDPKKFQQLMMSLPKKERQEFNPNLRNELNLVKLIAQKVFTQWTKPPLDLMLRLLAFRQKAAVEVLELQGRYEKGQLKYLLIYGLKRSREK